MFIILIIIFNYKVTALIVSDLSAAFDTIYYEILLHFLETSDIGVTANALSRFGFYFTGRTQVASCIRGHEYTCRRLVLLPAVSLKDRYLGHYVSYLHSTSWQVSKRHNLSFYFYANDAQSYFLFDQWGSFCFDSTPELLL